MGGKVNFTPAEAQFLKGIGFRVQYFRKLSNLSQEQLAEKAEVSDSTIAHIESTAPYAFSLRVLYKIAQALDIEPYRLLSLD